MCERNQGEPLAAYLLRLAITKPTSIFWLLGFAAAAWIYTDMKELITTNTTLMRETAAALREMNTRIQTLENKISTPNL